MSKWSELPPEIIQTITQKQTNYVDYIYTRAVCKSWRSALPTKPHPRLSQLPWLLLPYRQDTPTHRGFYNLADGKTYRLELPQAYEKRCCGSSHGWLVMVEESPSIFLLNPLTNARIDLPSLSTFPNFPTQVIYENCRNLNKNQIQNTKLRIRDKFIRKAIVSSDPSLSNSFTVAAIYSEDEKLALCKSGDVAWSVVPETTPPNYQDIMFLAGKLYAVDKRGEVSVCDTYNNDNNPPTKTHFADPPAVPPRMGYRQWYLGSLDGDLLLVGRFRRYDVPAYEYQTSGFVAYKLHQVTGKIWLKLESLGDKIMFLGWNCGHTVSAQEYNSCKGNCIYFTDNYFRSYDFMWEGHDFGVFEFEDGSVRRLGMPSYPIKRQRSPTTIYHESSLYRDRSVFLLPPPLWLTISP